MKLSSTHPLALLLDLASNVSAPRAHNKDLLPWPMLNTAESKESFEETARAVKRLELGQTLPPKWPFRSRAGKVVWTLHSIATLRLNGYSSSNDNTYCKNATICYVQEYFLELIFQRFFTWTVWRAIEKIYPWRQLRAEDIVYRNSFANPRAVLAMPLLVEMLRGMEAVIGQGNFGYRPSVHDSWIYPHLRNYLLSFYYPWIPDVPSESSLRIESNPGEAALRRSIERSQNVCCELWTILRYAPELRLKDSGNGLIVIPLCDIGKDVFSESNYAIGDFVKLAVTNIEIGLAWLWGNKEFEDEPRQSSYKKIQPADVENLKKSACHDIKDLKSKDQKSWLIEEFHETVGLSAMGGCKTALEYRLHQALDSPEWTTSRAPDNLLSYQVLLKDNKLNNLLDRFIEWRFLEERLRLTVDSLLLRRRNDEQSNWRKYYASRFESLGTQAVEVPEVQFNLQMPDPREDIWDWNLDQSYAQECGKWLEIARQDYDQGPEPFWTSGKYHRHALFEAYMKEMSRDRSRVGQLTTTLSKRRFLATAVLLAYLVPPPSEMDDDREYLWYFRTGGKRKDELNTETYLHSFEQLIETIDQRLSTALVQVDWQYLPFERIAELSEDKVTGPYWRRIGHRLIEMFKGQEFDIVSSELLKELYSMKLGDVREHIRDKGCINWRMINTERDHWDKKTRRFFSLRTSYSINRLIFLSMRVFGNGHNGIVTRLLNIERPIEETGGVFSADIFTRANDYADFIGTYVVWKNAAPRTNAWQDTDETGLSSWLSELYSQQMLVKHLGIDLVRHLRTRERERALRSAQKEALRSGFSAIMARNLSHNIGSHGLSHIKSGTLPYIQPEELNVFISYVKDRMDFIAEITTYWRSISW